MYDTITIPKQTFNNKQKHLKNSRKIKSSKNSVPLFIISLLFIFISSIYITNKISIFNNSRDLQFAIEYNFTHGYPSKNKLLRVQYITFISNDGKKAITEVSGLAKNTPHKKVTLKGEFLKSTDNIWYLNKIID